MYYCFQNLFLGNLKGNATKENLALMGDNIKVQAGVTVWTEFIWFQRDTYGS
jgi:hypothetical protein